MKVCPECGEGEFIERQNRVVEVSMIVYDHGQKEIIDSESDDEFRCADCGTVYYSTDELITDDEFNERNEDEVE